MNPVVELNLALILFLPWFAILAVLFWIYPRGPARAGRRWFDAVSLALSVIAACAGMYWSMANGDPRFGTMWKQILATSVSYGAFLATMATAFFLRRRWLAGNRSDRHCTPEALAR